MDRFGVYRTTRRGTEMNGVEHTTRVIKGVDARTGLPIDPNHWWKK
jgi:hypothetical protein